MSRMTALVLGWATLGMEAVPKKYYVSQSGLDWWPELIGKSKRSYP